MSQKGTTENWPLGIMAGGVAVALCAASFDINPNVQILLLLTFIRSIYNRIVDIRATSSFAVTGAWALVQTVLCATMLYDTVLTILHNPPDAAEHIVQELMSSIAGIVSVLFLVGSWVKAGVPWSLVAVASLGAAGVFANYVINNQKRFVFST